MTNRALFATLYLVLKILEQLSAAMFNIASQQRNVFAIGKSNDAANLLEQAFRQIDNAALAEGSTLQEILK